MISYSIIIPLWNKRNSILRAIHSAIKASKSFDVEIIVVNDGSTDGSNEIVKDFKSPLIKIINQPNLGASSARNAGVLISSGSHILFLDADDEWSDEHVKEIDLLIKRYPAAALYGTSYVRSNLDVIEKPDFFGVPLTRGEIESYFLSMAYGAMPIATSTACISRKVFDKCGGFLETITHGEDRALWAEASLKGAVVWSSKVTSTYYLDAENRSTDTWMPAKAMSYLNCLLKIERVAKNNNLKINFKHLKENIFSERYFLGRISAQKGYKLFPTKMAICLIPNYFKASLMLLSLVVFRLSIPVRFPFKEKN